MLSGGQDPDELFEIEQALKAAAVRGSVALLRQACMLLPGRLALVSSFGAESAVLLAIAADIDPGLPVVFLQTGMHFAETLEYREDLTEKLGLRNVIDVGPARAEVAASDPQKGLWHFDPDACCRLRKVTPLQRALALYKAWVSGRKRHQSSTRQQLACVEQDGAHLKINPLADWDAARVEAEIVRRGLPRHPLVAEGFPSIGCEPCTTQVAFGANPRSGRWMGTAKIECGIHSVEAAAG